MNIEDVYRALWRHKLFILAGTACVVAAAWFLTSRQTKIYQASTLVRVQQRTADPAEAYGLLSANAQLAQTYADIAQTYNIAQRISKQYGTRIPTDQIHIKAAPVTNLALMWINARSPVPEIAQAVARGAPKALQEFIRETGTLNDNILVVEKPGLPVTPVAPNVKLAVILALLVGLIFNGALALLRHMVSDRIADVDELERLAGVPVLATIPVIRFPHRSLTAQRMQTPTLVEAPFRGQTKPTSGEATRV